MDGDEAFQGTQWRAVSEFIGVTEDEMERMGLPPPEAPESQDIGKVAQVKYGVMEKTGWWHEKVGKLRKLAKKISRKAAKKVAKARRKLVKVERWIGWRFGWCAAIGLGG